MPSRRFFVPLMTAALAASPALAAPASRLVDAPSSAQSLPVAAAAQPGGSLVLKLRRSPTTVDLLVEGAGPSPVLRQGGNGTVWLGELRTATPTGLRLGPQRISLPEAGLQTISLTGSGTDYQIQVAPLPGTPLSRPVVSADGNNLIISFAAPAGASSPPTARLDLSQPGSIPQSSFAPPLQPRAVAPPLGDMAVGSMVLRNQSFVNASGPNVTLTLRNAPAKDALMAIAQLGGYGFVFVDDASPSGGASPQAIASVAANRLVTISFRNEGYARALNSVLLSAGLQGKRDGNMILAGPNVLGKSFGAQLSKVYRLNQASASSAADYLASLGASITKVNVITNSVTQGTTQANTVAGGPVSQQTETQRITTTETYGGGVGPLKGLTGTTDSRLQTITLVGDSQLISVAENYLRQIDLRQRQVALSVKILDISLDNASEIDNSFAFRFGNNFILNESGALVAQFGRDKAVAGTDPTGSVTTTTVTSSDAGGDSSFSNNSARETTVTLSSKDFQNLTDTQIRDINNTLSQEVPGISTFNSATRAFTFTPQAGTGTASLTDELSSRLESIVSRETGIDSQQIDTSTVRNANSGFANNRTTTTTTSTNRTPIGGTPETPASKFVDFLRAQIVSKSAKVLASPTLILSENQDEIPRGAEVSPQLGSSSGGSGSGSGFGAATIGRPSANEAFITVGEQVVTSYEVSQGTQGNVGLACEPSFGIAGLTFGARVSRIDDNGFVTFTMSPQITAKTKEVEIRGCGPIEILAVRRLDTGSARVRDGQTLVLTGVISDADVQTVSKWPILGDIPFIGQFFRSSSGDRRKRELVILVSPKIIDDQQGGGFGYGYQPSTPEARRLAGS